MLTINNILEVKDSYLKDALLYINGIHPTTDFTYYRNLLYATDNVSMNIKKYLAVGLYNSLIIGQYVYDAFNFSDEYKYLKQIRISNSLNNNIDEIFNTFNSLLINVFGDCETTIDKYKILMNFIKTQQISFMENLDIRIDQFMKNPDNTYAINKKKSIYLSETEERLRLASILKYQKEAYNNIPAYIPADFAKTRNKCIGNVGEYAVHNLLLTRNPYHLAKESGDGFGFDEHYILNVEKEEVLGEVKATIKNEDEDGFRLTDNERRVLADTLKINNSGYRVFRPFIDPDTIYPTKIIVLAPENENILYPINDVQDYIYEYNEKRDEYIKKMNTKNNF